MFTSILQPTHLLIVLIVALVFLGPKRLPDAGRALGQGLKEFKNSVSGGHEDDHQITAAAGGSHEESAPSPDAPQ
jgi:sec-independent protein translocase protein TatA